MKRIGIAVIIFIALAMGSYGAYTYYAANKTCVLGLNGYTANVTIKGANADAACDGLMAIHSGAFYLYRIDQSQGDVLCDGDNAKWNVHYTVRDSGDGTIGNMLCRAIEGQQTNPNS